MKKFILHDGLEREALEVFAGKEQYQDAQREWLEFVLPQEGNTVEALEAVFSAENCADLTLVDPQSGERFVYEAYVLRGPVRVYADGDGAWRIAVRRYQSTALEREVAALRSAVAAVLGAREETA